MSQAPTPYERQKNFVSDATNNPSITVPQVSTGLDAEFVAVQSSLNTAINRLGELQRDDGALRDAIVSAQSLSPTVAALLGLKGAVTRGAWEEATAYVAGDVVGNGGGTYLCVTSHTANSDFTVDQVAARWLTLEAPYNNNVTVQRFTGNGTQADFSLGVTGTVNVTNVFINGVYQNKDTYNVNGVSLAFTEAPPSGAIVEVVIGSISPVTAVVPDLSISTDKISNTAVTSAKIADGAITSAKIADGAITSAKIADGAITSAKIADGAVLTVDLANAAVTPEKLSTGGPSWDTSGNVGIGTSSPSAKLSVYGAGQTTAAISTSSSLDGSAYIQDSGGAVGNGGSIILGAQQGAFTAIKALITNGTSNTVGDLAFSTRNTMIDATLTERLRITALGNVGIGTSSPSVKLDIQTQEGQFANGLRVLPTPTSGSARASVATGGWEFGQDGSGNNIKTFYIFDGNTGQRRLEIGTDGTIYASGNTISNAKFAGTITGITNGSNAAAGVVGEVISATSGTVTLATSGVWSSGLTQITLTPGDWMVTGYFVFGKNATALPTRIIGSVWTDRTNLWSGNGIGSHSMIFAAPGAAADATAYTFSVAPVRYNVTTNTIVYLNAFAIFTGASASMTASGTIQAIRSR
jgi:hypothetical protein